MVKFETKFNGNVSRELSVRGMKKLWWVYAFFSVLFIFIGVLYLNSDMSFGIAMIVFGVLFAPLCIMLTRLLQKKVDKSMSVMSEETYEIYTFDENFFTIVQEKGGHIGLKRAPIIRISIKSKKTIHIIFCIFLPCSATLFRKTVLQREPLKILTEYLPRI